MSDLGRREWIALAALAFALLISATFLRANAHVDTAGRTPFIPVPVTPTLAEPTPSATLPTATPNPLPGPSGSWFVDYVTVSTGKTEGSLAFPILDFDLPGAPFPYMTDGDWRIEARTTFVLSPGQQFLTIEHTGDVTISVDGAEVASATGTGSPHRLSAVFDHPGGRATIRIVATDTAGPFLLRWLESE